MNSSRNLSSLKPLIAEPPLKIKPAIDFQILTAIDPEVLEDAYTYVHCYLDNDSKDMLIRVWKTTFLVDLNSGSRSSLVHAENVSMAPQWTMVPDGVTYMMALPIISF
jgi:hypothetical protein